MNKITRPRDLVKNLIATLYVLLVVFTPLIFVFDTNELFEFPKMYFVYIVGTTIGMLFLVSYILNPFKLVRPNIWVVLTLLSYLISTVFSTHVYTSLWGYFSRFNGGLISVLIFFILYYVLISFYSKNFIYKLLFLAQLTIVPISIYAIIQHYSLGVTRAYSTFGQPNWLAAYLCLCLPFVFTKLHKLFWLLVAVLGFGALWFSYSLSGIFGFVVLTVVFGFMIKPLIVKHYKSYVLYIVLCFIIAVTNLGLFSAKFQDFTRDVLKIVENSTFVYAQSSPLPVSSAADYKATDSGFIRTGLWLGSLKLAVSSWKNFLIGVGPETFPYQFQPYRPTELNYSSEWDYILNKPHNYFIQVLCETGVFGLGLYLLLLVWLFRSRDPQLVPAVVGYSVTNFFGWPTVATTLIFWFLISLVTLSKREEETIV